MVKRVTWARLLTSVGCKELRKMLSDAERKSPDEAVGYVFLYLKSEASDTSPEPLLILPCLTPVLVFASLSESAPEACDSLAATVKNGNR